MSTHLISPQRILHVAHRCKNVKEIATFYKDILMMDLLVCIAEDWVLSTKEPFLDAGMEWEIYWPYLKSMVKVAEVPGITHRAQNECSFCYS